MAKLAKLKTLSLRLISFEDTITSFSSIFELVGSLPNLQELHLDLSMCNPPTEEAAGTRSPTAFPCLKALKLTDIDLGNAFEMIRSFPNLQTLEINACNENDDSAPAVSFPEVDCNTMGPLQLRSVVFKNLEGSENEVRLIKYLLACSPFLKKIVIRPNSLLVPPFDEKLFARKLLKLHRASPTAEIDLY
ncbi:uncharacterized protein LOC143591698 [Bidens hawaiensis]|uniref:uncharacterized protein LOC143591698 n=1 Tax=Bidens hawaiensis TaxID=980011 RepID=UPI0040494C3E